MRQIVVTAPYFRLLERNPGGSLHQSSTMRACIPLPHYLLSINNGKGRAGSNCIGRRNSRAQTGITDSCDRRSFNRNKTLLGGDDGTTNMRSWAGIDLGADMHVAFKGDWAGGHWLLLLN